MTDDKREEPTDERRHLVRERVAREDDIRFDTGDENRYINEPSRPLIAGTVPDEVAKESARKAYAEDRDQVIGGRDDRDSEDRNEARTESHRRAPVKSASQTPRKD